MNATPTLPIPLRIDAVYRADARRVFATLVRLLGDFDLAEDALQEAFAAALTQWARDGMPSNPRAWLVSAGRFKAIDSLRRRARFQNSLAALAAQWDREEDDGDATDDDGIEDDRLRLIFTCCHPALSLEARVALTLREVCGLTTEEVASAFLIPSATLAQRIVRAKSKIRTARISYQIPTQADLPARRDAVLAVIYLVFTQGYVSSSGASGPNLAQEAIRLARLLRALRPEPETAGLLALMLLHDSRRAARLSSSGNLILLEDQDRALWDQGQIGEGKILLEEALRSRHFGFYTLQAAIAAVHTDAPDAQQTDWPQIVALYGVLMHRAPSPVVALNRAVAIAMVAGPTAGLALVDAALADATLADYAPAHAARADLCRRLGRMGEARASYTCALALTQQDSERRFLRERLCALAQ